MQKRRIIHVPHVIINPYSMSATFVTQVLRINLQLEFKKARQLYSMYLKTFVYVNS